MIRETGLTIVMIIFVRFYYKIHQIKLLHTISLKIDIFNYKKSLHEKNTFHLNSFQTWKELDARISKEKTKDNINQQNIKEEVQYWRQILERLIALIALIGVLATQKLAFCRTKEQAESIREY